MYICCSDRSISTSEFYLRRDRCLPHSSPERPKHKIATAAPAGNSRLTIGIANCFAIIWYTSLFRLPSTQPFSNGSSRYANCSIPPRCAPRHSGNAHRCYWTPDDCLGSRDEAVAAEGRRCLSEFMPAKPLSEFESTKPDGSCQQYKAKSFQHDHFLPPITKCVGKSSISEISFRSIFFALVGFLKLKSSAAASSPVFQSLS